MVGAAAQPRWFPALGCGLVCLFVPAARGETGVMEAKLLKTTTLSKGIAANTTLKDALEILGTRGQLGTRVDVALFKKKGMPDAENQTVKLPRLVHVRLATAFSLLAAQVNGACVLWKDELVVIPRNCVGGARGLGYKLLPGPLREDAADVKAKLDKPVTVAAGIAANTPFKEALRVLRENSDLNLVVEENSKKQARALERSQVCLPDIDRTPLGEVLQKLCTQANATYRVEGDLVWISPGK